MQKNNEMQIKMEYQKRFSRKQTEECITKNCSVSPRIFIREYGKIIALNTFVIIMTAGMSSPGSGTGRKPGPREKDLMVCKH